MILTKKYDGGDNVNTDYDKNYYHKKDKRSNSNIGNII